MCLDVGRALVTHAEKMLNSAELLKLFGDAESAHRIRGAELGPLRLAAGQSTGCRATDIHITEDTEPVFTSSSTVGIGTGFPQTICRCCWFLFGLR